MATPTFTDVLLSTNPNLTGVNGYQDQVLFNGSGLWDWEDVEKGMVAIVSGVNRPYSQRGKTAQGNWTTAPAQYVLEPSSASIHWGVFSLKDPNWATNHYVYVYGLRNMRDEQTNPYRFNDVVLARVPCTVATDFVNYSNWRYYSNGSWVTDQNAANPTVYLPRFVNLPWSQVDP